MKLTLAFPTRGHLASLGTPIAVTATLDNKGQARTKVRLSWNVRSTEMPVTPIDPSYVEVGAGEIMSFVHQVHLTRPGFIELTCVAGTEKAVVRVGRQPEKINASLTRQSDFDSFWRQSMTALNKVPMQMTAREVSRMNGIITSEVTLHSFGSVRVRGWLEIPEAPGPHPAVIRVPGYNGNMEPISTAGGLIVFSFNPRAHGHSQDDVPGLPTDYWLRGLDNKDAYFYRGAYLDCVRAAQFVLGHPAVDAKRVAIWGGSQGGGLAFATAALVPNMALCLADVPFLCDWENYFKLCEWTEVDKWIADAPGRTRHKILRTLSYFDTMNLAERIRCPVRMGVGLQDKVCPPSTSFAVFNRTRGRKEFNIYANYNHGVPQEHYDEGWKWIRRNFGIA